MMRIALALLLSKVFLQARCSIRNDYHSFPGGTFAFSLSAKQQRRGSNPPAYSSSIKLPIHRSPLKLFTSVSHQSEVNRPSTLSFSSPLLESGYVPVVREYSLGILKYKPLLLYIPGFDGTCVAPFLQFPELSTEFDVRGLCISMDDRSSFDILKQTVVEYIGNLSAQYESTISDGEIRPVYIMGDSFGGTLALEVALELSMRSKCSSPSNVNLQGLVLINPATSYNRSNLAKEAPSVSKLPQFLYPFALLIKLVPLFTDAYALPQLLLMLQSKALPSIIDDAQREAYMGRQAFSLPQKLKFMPRETLQWRLEKWLTAGCNSIRRKETLISEILTDLPTLIVAGELDNALPSVSEANRLSNILRDVVVHVVKGAGHANTSGSRVDLTAVMRARFPQLLQEDGRTQSLSSFQFPEDNAINIRDKRIKMKERAAAGRGIYFGMEPRYDGADFGLSPLKYWSPENFQEWNNKDS